MSGSASKLHPLGPAKALAYILREKANDVDAWHIRQTMREAADALEASEQSMRRATEGAVYDEQDAYARWERLATEIAEQAEPSRVSVSQLAFNIAETLRLEVAGQSFRRALYRAMIVQLMQSVSPEAVDKYLTGLDWHDEGRDSGLTPKTAVEGNLRRFAAFVLRTFTDAQMVQS